MRASALVALLLLASCSEEIPGIGCESDSDCNAGRCLNEVCVEVEGCEPECGAYEECLSGACASPFTGLLFLEPADRSRLQGEIVAAAKLVPRDGFQGVIPSTLALEAIHLDGALSEHALALDAATGVHRVLLSLGRGGHYTLRASLPGTGLSAEVGILLDQCDEACASDAECRGADCVVAFAQPEIVQPLPGAWVDSPFVAEARLARLEGAVREYPKVLRAVVSGAEEVQADIEQGETGQYRGTLEVTAGGVYTLRIMVPGGELSAQSTLFVNRCEAACDAGMECLLAECIAPFSELQIIRPEADAEVERRFGIEARLVRREGARTAFPPALVVLTCSEPGTCSTSHAARAGETGTYLGFVEVALGGSYTVSVEASGHSLAASVPIVVHHCEPGCAAYQTCIGRDCRFGFSAIGILVPPQDARVDEHVIVQAKLEAESWAGKPPEVLELRALHLATEELETSILPRLVPIYSGLFLPMRGGAYELRVVWSVSEIGEPLLVSEPVRVKAIRCPWVCGVGRECIEGECVSAFERVELISPLAGTIREQTVPVVARLVRRDSAQAVPPASLTLSVAHSPEPGTPATAVLTNVSGTDEFTGTWKPEQEGAYELVAICPELGLQGDAVAMTVDMTAPRFDLTWDVPVRLAHQLDPEPGYANAIRRDEAVVVRVTSASTDVDEATVTLTASGITGSGSRTVALAPGAGSCSSGLCLEGLLDAADPAFEMNAFRGEIVLQVTGKDLVGNQAAEADSARVPVTRWKWSFDAQAGPIRSAPAIGKGGRVFFGTSLNAAPWGKVVAVDPDGTEAWSFGTDGPVESSVAIGSAGGKEVVFVAGRRKTGTSTYEGAIWALDWAGPGAETNPVCTGGVWAVAHIGVMKTRFPSDDEDVPAATAVFNNGQASMLVAARAGTTAASCVPAFLTVESESSTGFGLAGDTAFFGDKSGRLNAFKLSAQPSWAALTGWPITLTGGLRWSNPVIQPLVILGGAIGTTGALVSQPRAGESATLLETSAPIWNPCLHSTGLAAGSEDGKLLLSTIDLSIHSAIPLSTSPMDNTIVTGAPAVGSDQTLYLASQGGRLYARTSTGAPLWDTALGAASDSSPALDCARNATGQPISRPGVLYVGADDGKLYALVVDSHGLDTTAPWPKFHRDPHNSADANIDLLQFTCP